VYNPDLLVLVKVPTKGDGAAATSAVKVGTAYPIAADLLIAAKHVVCPPNRDRTRPIKIRWEGKQDGPENGWHCLADDAVVREHPTLDAVVIRCPDRPPDRQGYGFLSSSPVPDQGEWSSGGYASAARRETADGHIDRKPIGFHGKTYIPPSQSDYFEIGIEDELRQDTDYRGASGMPIFLKNRNEIIGIAREVPENLGSRRLHAVPGNRLLEDTTLRQLLGLNTDPSRKRTFIRAMSGVLSQSPQAVEYLRDVSGLCSGARDSPDDIATCLSELTDVTKAARGFRDTYEAIRRNRRIAGDEALARAQEVLVGAIQIIVPFLSETHHVGQIRTQLRAGGIVFMQIPCAFEMVAEIYMAAAENRQMELERRKQEAEYPLGVRARPTPPIGGIDDTDGTVAAIRADLNAKFDAGKWDTLRRNIDDVMIDSLVRPGRGPRPENSAEEIRNAAIQLEIQTRYARCYLVVRPPAETSARRELEEGLKVLARDYPALVILWLTGNDAAAERLMFGDVQQMLPRHD
jgi:hypothetical protein